MGILCVSGVSGVSAHNWLTIWSVRQQNPQLLESLYFLRHIGTKEEGFTWGQGFRGDIIPAVEGRATEAVQCMGSEFVS